MRLVAILAVALLAAQLALAERRQASPEVDEPARVAAQIRSLETSPLTEESRKQRTRLFQWLTETPQVQLKWCAGVLTDMPEKDQDYWAGVAVQVILSAGAFVIENPSEATNDLLIARAGLRGALLTYRATLKSRPERDSAFLAALAAQEDAGTLDDYLIPRMADCNQP